MRVLVTGGTGTFGTAFVDYVLETAAAERVVVYSRDEQKQQTMAWRLLDKHQDRLRLVIGDVRDPDRLALAMWGIDTVVHAAALKIIGQGTSNPDEMHRTNVLGTENVLRAALASGVQRVLVLSSDKGVQPVNFYGYTKAMAEALTVQWNIYGYPRGCRSAAVRYGNVLGSRGSVLHVFREAARLMRPLPITDPRMTRFWITQEQAVRFVLDCLDRMRGAEVFVPCLPSLRVVDLGAAVLGKDALEPGDYEVVGIRPGEKLHEALICPDEASRTRQQEGFFVVEPPQIFWRNRQPWAGTTLPEGFSLPSGDNPDWLTVAQMADLLRAVP